MNKPTPEQIAAEIAALQALKPSGPFARKTQGMIDDVIDALRNGIDTTAEEWDEMDREVQMLMLDADGWKHGQRSERPSAGWEGLVK